MSARVPEQIGVAFALTAFAVAIACGIAREVPAQTLILRSVVVLIAAAAIGRMLGHFINTAVDEHLRSVTARNPVPEPIPVPEPGRAASASTDGEGP